MGLEPQLVSGAMPSPGSSSINKISNKLDNFSKARKLRVSNLDEVGSAINKVDVKSLTAADIPTVKSGKFAEFFNNLSVEELEYLWSDKAIRRKIERQLRYPGGMH